MSRRRSPFEKATGKRPDAQFARLPRSTLQCEAVRTLAHLDFRVLTIAAAEMGGGNNGDLALVRSVLAAYGVTRSGHVQVAISELLARGLLVLTRQGDRRRCALYALAWHELTQDPKRLEKLDRPLPVLPDMRFKAWREISLSGDQRAPRWRPEGAITGPNGTGKTTYGDQRAPKPGGLWRPEGAPLKNLPWGSGEKASPPGQNSCSEVPFPIAGQIPEKTQRAIVRRLRAGENREQLACAFDIPADLMRQLAAEAEQA